MKFLEKDLETIIFEADNLTLDERGLAIRGKKYRQVKIGGYGICDLLTYFRLGETIYITIYELKQDKVDLSAMHQAIKYREGIIRFFDKRFPNVNLEIDVILVGKEIDLISSFAYFLNQVDWLSAYTYSYDIDGLSFNFETDYCLSHNGFGSKIYGLKERKKRNF